MSSLSNFVLVPNFYLGAFLSNVGMHVCTFFQCWIGGKFVFNFGGTFILWGHTCVYYLHFLFGGIHVCNFFQISLIGGIFIYYICVIFVQF